MRLVMNMDDTIEYYDTEYVWYGNDEKEDENLKQALSEDEGDTGTDEDMDEDGYQIVNGGEDEADDDWQPGASLDEDEDEDGETGTDDSDMDVVSEDDKDVCSECDDDEGDEGSSDDEGSSSDEGSSDERALTDSFKIWMPDDTLEDVLVGANTTEPILDSRLTEARLEEMLRPIPDEQPTPFDLPPPSLQRLDWDL
jgi:hypothetical protein